MKNKHINILYPQWQGGGTNKATYEGAMELKKNYLNMDEFFEIEVSSYKNEKVENNIWGYKSIMEQLKNIKELLNNENPDTVFTVGGGDDIEIIPLSYMNNQMKGDMSVVFFDAHGDLNTPESSPSKNFHGMPLRTLFGESDKEILNLLYSRLLHSQVVMVGTRDCDLAEKEYIKNNNISVITAKKANSYINNVIEELKSKGSKNIYIHIDVDVIDPSEFSYQPVPAKGGLTIDNFSKLLKALSKEFHIVGVCLLGCTALNNEKINILQEIINIGIGI